MSSKWSVDDDTYSAHAHFSAFLYIELNQHFGLKWIWNTDSYMVIHRGFCSDCEVTGSCNIGWLKCVINII